MIWEKENSWASFYLLLHYGSAGMYVTHNGCRRKRASTIKSVVKAVSRAVNRTILNEL